MRHRLADQAKTRLRTQIRVLTACSGSATAFGGALARSHGSDLLPLRLPFVHRPAVPFVASPALREVSRTLPRPRVLPDTDAHFVPPFSGFGLASPLWVPARVVCTVLDAVATGYPLGNCDSRRLETRQRYLTRLGAVSHRSWPPSSYFALLTARERRQRNW